MFSPSEPVARRSVLDCCEVPPNGLHSNRVEAVLQQGYRLVEDLSGQL